MGNATVPKFIKVEANMVNWASKFWFLMVKVEFCTGVVSVIVWKVLGCIEVWHFVLSMLHRKLVLMVDATRGQWDGRCKLCVWSILIIGGGFSCGGTGKGGSSDWVVRSAVWNYFPWWKCLMGRGIHNCWLDGIWASCSYFKLDVNRDCCVNQKKVWGLSWARLVEVFSKGWSCEDAKKGVGIAQVLQVALWGFTNRLMRCTMCSDRTNGIGHRMGLHG